MEKLVYEICIKSHRKLQLYSLAVFAILLYQAPSASSTQTNEMAGHIGQTDLRAQFARNLEQFSNRMYEQLVATEKGDENIIFSPFSIQTCVAMARLGAVGETAAQLDRGLSLISGDLNAIATSFGHVLEKYVNSKVLKIANKIYVRKGSSFQSEFHELVSKKFYSEAEQIDFSNNVVAAANINNWVEGKTNNRIKNLVTPTMINRDTHLVLLNAVHFKGEWEHPFEKHNTQNKDFYMGESETVKVPMMRLEACLRYIDLPHLEATALEMPYKDSDLTMLVILPNSPTGLKVLEQKLKNVNLVDVTRNMNPTDMVVQFPKFKAEFEVELNEHFKKLGMDRMFTTNAEFHKMVENSGQLVVSKILHKAFIEVNEVGTEAAAATAVILSDSMPLPGPRKPIEFNANRQFFYAIRSRVSEHILFMGATKKI